MKNRLKKLTVIGTAATFVLFSAFQLYAGTITGSGTITVEGSTSNAPSTPTPTTKELQIQGPVSVKIKPGARQIVHVSFYNPDTVYRSIKSGSFKVVNKGTFKGKIWTPNLENGSYLGVSAGTTGQDIMDIYIEAASDEQGGTYNFTYSVETDA